MSSLLDDLELIGIDLPGFGEAPASHGLTVDEMANYVVRIIAESGATQWLIIGHSMGGKVASVVTSRALAGEPGICGLRGVILLAGSPPSPEPMDESRRERMLA